MSALAMTPDEIRELLPFLTAREREEVDALLAADFAEARWRALPGPQLMAWNSKADITGYGGAAGGGKTDLIAGLASGMHHRSLIIRREKSQVEGIVQRMTEILGDSKGLNNQKGIWQLPTGGVCEFGGLDNPGDELRWKGRDHDLKAFDEVTDMREAQVRFAMGWCRTAKSGVHPRVLFTFNPPTKNEGRWVVAFFGPWIDKSHPLYPTAPGELRYATMLPDKSGVTKDHWLTRGDPFVLVNGEPCYEFDHKDYRLEDIIIPKSRTFIPARLTDNPYYLASGYMSTLQAMEEPLRSQMLNGDFEAGMQDGDWQLCPTAWVDAAMKRWRPIEPQGEMLSMGVDVARGGKDNTTIATRHATPDGGKHWYAPIKTYPGTTTPDGPRVAGLVVGARRDHTPVHIDVIGVGASPYDTLNSMGIPVYGINVAEKALGTDKSGTLRFLNQRSELYWRLREALDPANNTGIMLPPDDELRKELCAIDWEMSGKTIKVESREDILKKIGRSVDRATAVMLAGMDTPKVHLLRAARAQEETLNYDPMANTHGPGHGVAGYDPMGRR